MAKYGLDPISDNCYPDTVVLVNKFDIRDELGLNEIETAIVSSKLVKLEEQPISGVFDFEHYRAIHRYLFEDLYDWAGEIRTVNISKKGTRFCPYTQIVKQAELTFEYLNKQSCFVGLPHDDFVSEIVDFYCSTNYLHPFREGNGRTQRAFITDCVSAQSLSLSVFNSAEGITASCSEIIER